MGTWTELKPVGPTKDWADHDPTKCGQAWSRKWVKPHPSEPAWWLTIEISAWPCRSWATRRRWFTTEHRFELWLGDPHDYEANPDKVSLLRSSSPGEHMDPSYTDGPIGEEWPTDEDIRNEVGRVRQPADWNGDW